jgi:hypothetical protein
MDLKLRHMLELMSSSSSLSLAPSEAQSSLLSLREISAQSLAL